MRTAPIVAAVLALGVAFTVIAGSGVGASIFGETGDSAAESTLEDLSEDAEIGEGEGEGIGGDVGSDDEPTVTAFILSGASFAIDLVAAIALLPVTMANLGFPTWFAIPIGGTAQIIGAIGFVQFVTGREFL